MPIAQMRRVNTSPKALSLSRTRYVGVLSHGKASVIWRRHSKRQPNSSSMPYDDKTIENPERDRRKDKKVDRRNAVGMVAQKRTVCTEN